MEAESQSGDQGPEKVEPGAVKVTACLCSVSTDARFIC